MKRLSFLVKAFGDLLKRCCDKFARMIYHPKPTAKDLAWDSFCNAGGEQLRFEYNILNQDAVIFDLGGYEGQWASDMYSRFRSKVFVFEVYTPYYNNIKERFLHNDDIKVYNFGLSSKNTTTKISIDGFSTSAFKKSDDMVEIDLKNASDFILENETGKIDLMKINIEGGEYELLDHLINTGIVKTIDNLQIQFHDFVPDALINMNRLRDRLSLTHYPTYKFDFIWDNWKLKD